MRILILLLFSLNFTFTFCQEDFFSSRHIGMEEGLSHYKVLSFYPTSKGMWIGTADGLNYYDGFNWKYWKQEDGQLNFKAVDFIHSDQNQHLWLFNTTLPIIKSMFKAIDILDPQTNQLISFSEKFKDKAPFRLKDVEVFFEDNEHRLYFFANQHLWRIIGDGLFENIVIPKGFHPIKTFSDGTYVGLIDKKVAIVSSSGDLIFQSEYIIQDKIDDVLGSTERFIVWHQDHLHQLFKRQADNTYQPQEFPELSPGEKIHPLFFDQNKDQFWLYSDEKLHMIDFNGKSYSQPFNAPRNPCVDKNGNIWFAEHGITILKSQQQKFRRFLYQEDKTISTSKLYRSRGILEKDGQLYVNTYLGSKVIDLSNGEISSLLEEDHRVNFVIMKGRNNDLWFANRGLTQLDSEDKNVSKTFHPEFPENADRAWSILEDVNGKIWIGEEGLSFLEDGKVKLFEKYNEFTQLQDALVLDLFKDKNGLIWVVSSKGLYQLNLQKGIVAGYGKSRKGNFKLPSNKFQHMYQDDDGIYWLATEDAGLIKWNKMTGEIKTFDEKNDFLSKNIYAVYEDDFGFLWLSSFNGLIRFNKEKEKSIVFTVEDGITENEFNRISHHQNEQGYIYFGGQNGVTGFDPKDFLEYLPNQNFFQLEIDHVSILGSKTLTDTLADGSKIDLANLSSESSVIDLELMSSDIFWTGNIELHYTLEKLEYAKVKNTSREFISPDNHIELFGMLPGEYQLKIKAIQNNGKQLGETLIIPINIAPPFFQTIPFWISLLLSVVLSSWGLVKFRTARLRKRKIELEKQVKERTEQILKNRKELAQERLEKEQLEKQLLNEKLKQSNYQMKQIIADNSMRLKFKQEFLEKVKQEERKLNNADASRLRSLITDLQSQIITESKFETIGENVEQLDKAFDEKIRTLYPTLTKSEREVCALMRMNLSLKEVMTIRNVSLASIKSTRYRIRKKMGLKREQELEQVISELV